MNKKLSADIPPSSKRGKFLDKLSTNFISPEKLKTTANLRYWARDGRMFTVPKGTVTDLASVPAVFRSLTSMLGAGWSQTARSGVFHDHLYQKGPKIGVTRKDADKLMRHALQSDGVSRTVSWLIYLALRVGGWKAWNRWREKNA